MRIEAFCPDSTRSGYWKSAPGSDCGVQSRFLELRWKGCKSFRVGRADSPAPRLQRLRAGAFGCKGGLESAWKDGIQQALLLKGKNK